MADMQHVSSLGGPRILLPTAEVERWMEELGDDPNPDEGLYGVACSVEGYCGVVAPWGAPLLVFGDDPADIFHAPGHFDGLLFRWVGAESLEELAAFAVAEAQGDAWDEIIAFEVLDGDMTLMDTCAAPGDGEPRIRLRLRPGPYAIRSRYAESPEVMTILHRFERLE